MKNKQRIKELRDEAIEIERQREEREKLRKKDVWK